MSSGDANMSYGSQASSKADLDNKSSQCNPNNPEYKGHTSAYSGTGTKADLSNHGDQLNPNNPEYKSGK